MSDRYTNEPLLDMFIFETTQLLEQLEQAILSNEKECSYSQESIHEIFRIMHTIKGSSAMMLFHDISLLAHTMEDLFYYLRENKPIRVDYPLLSDLILDGVDFVKIELEKIKVHKEADGSAGTLISNLKEFLLLLKHENLADESKDKRETKNTDKEQKDGMHINADNDQFTYKTRLVFEECCGMENIRAYTVIKDLKDIAEKLVYLPEDIMDNDESIDIIRKEGFHIFIKTDYEYDRLYDYLSRTIFLKELELTRFDKQEELPDIDLVKGITSSKRIILTDLEEYNSEEDGQKNPVAKQEAAILGQDIAIEENDKAKISKEKLLAEKEKNTVEKEGHATAAAQSIISVSVLKLDKLMDLVGEMVIAEDMVIQNPDLQGLILDNFQKASRQLSKITSEIQDMVMAIRMVPLSATFHKMYRIVRDMNKKLGKEAELEIIGEDTEVDKNIIEHISDPLMHLVRNALDHGIESEEERRKKGKNSHGTITLEAHNAGSDVLVTVKDDGIGLDKLQILEKARRNGLLTKNEADMSEKEIYNLILLPGFSTKENVTEFSGRGVGMDVVTKNIEVIGGSLLVDSAKDKGSTITLKIPLTLAIIDGMTIKTGNAYFTIPTNSIKESFRPEEKDLIMDPDGNEMIMVRGQCYPILRLHEHYRIKTDITVFINGIFIMVEQEERKLCIFADQLIGQQQVVVKSLPEYINRIRKVKGIGGCTMLGDGSISLILDVAGLINAKSGRL